MISNHNGDRILTSCIQAIAPFLISGADEFNKSWLRLFVTGYKSKKLPIILLLFVGGESVEFDIEPATARIVDALALIGKLFEQENYLQGIALLAAAQKTFLKCAIKNEIDGRNGKSDRILSLAHQLLKKVGNLHGIKALQRLVPFLHLPV